MSAAIFGHFHVAGTQPSSKHCRIWCPTAIFTSPNNSFFYFLYRIPLNSSFSLSFFKPIWASGWFLLIHFYFWAVEPAAMRTSILGTYLSLLSWRCPWCNGYCRRIWTYRHEFKSWTWLIAFHIALIPLGKVWIQIFSLQLWVNSRAD